MQKAIFYLLLFILALSPLPLGSNRSWASNLIAIMMASLCFLWVLQALYYKQRISIILPLFMPISFFILLFGIFLQTVAWVPMAWHHPIWEMTGHAISRISIAKDSTLNTLVSLITYALTFALSFQLCRNRYYAEMILQTLMFCGVVYSLYGLIVYWGDIERFSWLLEFKSTRLNSTFVNPNNYATYAGLCLIGSCAILTSRILSLSHSWHILPLKQLEQLLVLCKLPIIAILLLVTSLLLSHSRGGIISTFIALIVYLIIIVIRGRIYSRKIITMICLCIILLASFAFFEQSQPFLSRLSSFSLTASVRANIYSLTVEAIKDNPIFGYGLGTFNQGFALYRNELLPLHVQSTHNTYLEVAFNLGLPATLLALMIWIGMIVICLKGIKNRQRDWLYPVVGVASSVLVGCHALVDFSIQIPAIALLYMIIMGMACAQSYSSLLGNER